MKCLLWADTIHLMEQAKVFISSILDATKEDLRPEREVVREVVASFEFLKPWAFEHEPASSDSLDESYLRNVDSCDLFLLIVGKEATDPVTKETLRALDRGKPILIFAKKTEDRSPQAQLLLKTPNKKYATFDALTDLRQRVREAILQTLVKGLTSLQEGGGASSILFQLREMAARYALVDVRPTIPNKAEHEPFQIVKAEQDAIEIQKLSCGQLIHIPTSRIKEILSFGQFEFGQRPCLILNGRLQWLTRKLRWQFLDEAPLPDSAYGFSKPSSLQDGAVIGLVENLRANNIASGFVLQQDLPVKLGEGWEIVYDDDGRYFRVPDKPCDQILICKGS